VVWRERRRKGRTILSEGLSEARLEYGHILYPLLLSSCEESTLDASNFFSR
jgi:hypothetical protein